VGWAGAPELIVEDVESLWKAGDCAQAQAGVSASSCATHAFARHAFACVPIMAVALPLVVLPVWRPCRPGLPVRVLRLLRVRSRRLVLLQAVAVLVTTTAVPRCGWLQRERLTVGHGGATLCTMLRHAPPVGPTSRTWAARRVDHGSASMYAVGTRCTPLDALGLRRICKSILVRTRPHLGKKPCASTCIRVYAYRQVHKRRIASTQ
jgi:hypothetical protein